MKIDDRQIQKGRYVVWSVSTGLGVCRIQFYLADVQVNCTARHFPFILPPLILAFVHFICT
jgi:hypothetical protein